MADSAAIPFAFDAGWVAVRPATVTVAGTFNNWNLNSHPLADSPTGFRTTVPLGDGDYEYKFHVVDEAGNSYWLTDRSHARYAPDQHGGVNSLLRVRGGAPSTDPSGLEAFEYSAPDAGYVNLTGDFVEWRQGSIDLQRDPDGVWRCHLKASLPLTYQFIVDGLWLADPSPTAAVPVPNNYGSMNSLRPAPTEAEGGLDWLEAPGEVAVAKSLRLFTPEEQLASADAAAREGRYRDAIALCRQAATMAHETEKATGDRLRGAERAALAKEAQVHRRFGFAARALPAWERLRTLHPDTAEGRWAQNEVAKHYLYGAKDPAMARLIFGELLARASNPRESASALYDIGVAYYSEDRFEDAIAAFRQAIDVGGAPDRGDAKWNHLLAEAHTYLGICEYRGGMSPRLAYTRFAAVPRISHWPDSQDVKIAETWMRYLENKFPEVDFPAALKEDNGS